MICWGRLAKVWALLVQRSDRGIPGRHSGSRAVRLGHRVWLGPHAASHGVTIEMVIQDIVDRVPVP